MANEFAVKEYKFTLVLGSNPVADSTYETFSDANVNGRILTVEIGSLFIAPSGELSGTTIFSRIAPSGAGWQHAAPREFGQLNSGSVTAATMQQYIVNSKLNMRVVAASGTAVSGVTYTAIVRWQ
jgi:hypothetical protein